MQIFNFCDGHVTTFRHPSGAYIFWSKPSVKVEIKTTWEVVSTCEVLRSAWRAKWLRIVPVSEKLRKSPWGFVSKGGRRPQRSMSTMVNGDSSTSHLRNVRRMGLGGRYRNADRQRNTSMTVKSSDWEVYEVVSAQLLAFARLLSLV